MFFSPSLVSSHLTLFHHRSQVSFRYHCQLYSEWRRTNQKVRLLMPDMKGAHTTQRSVPTKLTKKMTDETIVWAQSGAKRKPSEPLSKTQTKKRNPIILMNFCTSYGPFLRGEIHSPNFFHRGTWCKMYWLATKVVLARTHSRVTVHVKTHSCHRTGQCWDVNDTNNGLAGPTVCRWHKCIKY